MTPTERRLFDTTVSVFEQPVLGRRLTPYMVVPAAVFLGAFLVSLSAGAIEAPINLHVDSTYTLPGANLTPLEIFTNNATLLATILIGGTVTFTLGTFLLLIINALHFSSGIGFLLDSYGELGAIVGFLPHGVFEIAAFLLAANVSVRLSVLLATWHVRGWGGWPDDRIVRAIATRVGLAFALIAVAAIVETTVTVALVSAIG